MATPLLDPDKKTARDAKPGKSEKSRPNGFESSEQRSRKAWYANGSSTTCQRRRPRSLGSV